MIGVACDLCGGAPSPAPTASQDWIVDVAPSPSPGFNPTTFPAASFGIGSSSPNWNFAVAKTLSMPYRYSCENPTGSFSSQTAACAPAAAGFPAPCTERGSTGFCTAAFDGCGRTISSKNAPYNIEGNIGDSCCQVSCRTDLGLICAIDNSSYQGKCVARIGCVTDADCNLGGTCYLATGTCYGGGPGPGTSACSAIAPPAPPAPPPPLPTPTPAPTAPPVGTCSALVCGGPAGCYLPVWEPNSAMCPAQSGAFVLQGFRPASGGTGTCCCLEQPTLGGGTACP
jgi:hypothetical protein